MQQKLILPAGQDFFRSANRSGIDDSVSAAQRIDGVRSANLLIGADITAPSVGAVIAKGATVPTQCPMPTFSESHSFNSAAPTANTLLIPAEYQTLKPEHSQFTSSSNRKPKTLLSRGLAAFAVVLQKVGGLLSLRACAHTQPQPLAAAVALAFLKPRKTQNTRKAI